MALVTSKLNYAAERMGILFVHVSALCSLDCTVCLHVHQKSSLIQMSLCSLASALCVHSYCFLCSSYSFLHEKCMKLNKRSDVSAVQDDSSAVSFTSIIFRETVGVGTVFLHFYLTGSQRSSADWILLVHLKTSLLYILL